MIHLKKLVLVSLLVASLCGGCIEKDDFLAEFDTTELFAPPTSLEIEAVKADWATRDLTPSNYQVEQTIILSDGKTVFKTISYTLDGLKEYAALLIPSDGSDLPVQIYVGGFGLGIIENSIAIAPSASSKSPAILAIPALRGQSLKISLEGKTYLTPTSDGIHCDAFDGGADDGIGLLNLLELTEPRVNVNRTAVRGGSRGATVALLMAERDKRVQMAFAIAGPTDLLNLTSKNQNDLTYQCQFLDDLVKNGGTLEEARKKMIASSPLYFAKDLPYAQVHLGQKDPIVPVSEGERLKAEVEKVGNPGKFELFIYEGRGHGDITLENVLLNQRIEALLSQL